MRLAIIGCCLLWPLLLLVPASGKPLLYIVESESCQPCRQFAHHWTNTTGFADRLRSAYDVRGLHWEDPTHQRLAREMGVKSLPSFVIVSPTGRRIGMIVGYSHETALLTELGLPPLTRPISQRRENEAQQQKQVGRPEASQSTTDSAARREIQRLEQSMQSLQRQLMQLGKAPESSEELQSLRRTVEELKAAAKTVSPAESLSQSKLPVEPILTPDATPNGSSALLAMAVKVGTTMLLPEVAIPAGALSIAATVGGWWLGRRRRKSRPSLQADSWNHGSPASGPDQNSVTVLRETTARQNTANHFIVKETDKVGEAYKEAIRRITAAYKSDKPGIVDVASQIEHVAHEILRGQQVSARASTAPRPGLWTEED